MSIETKFREQCQEIVGGCVYGVRDEDGDGHALNYLREPEKAVQMLEEAFYDFFPAWMEETWHPAFAQVEAELLAEYGCDALAPDGKPCIACATSKRLRAAILEAAGVGEPIRERTSKQTEEQA